MTGDVLVDLEENADVRMTDLIGFWSYVHADDDADGGRIIRLARDVAAQFEMLTGEGIDLFLDKDAIKWGENWRNEIDSSLASVAFFIPVLTPRYFLSPECRRELRYFARRATDLGVRELVLPILYVDVPALHEDDPVDELVDLIKTFQWDDWRDLRFLESDSEGYRRGVARLSSRLVEANAKAENIASAPIEREQLLGEEPDESLGVLDRLAAAEETFPQWEATLREITDNIELIGQVMEKATADIKRNDAHGKGFTARLAIARRVSRSLREPAGRIQSLGNKFVSQLHKVDGGIRTIITLASNEVDENPDLRVEVCDFFQLIQELSFEAREGLGGVQSMIDAISPLESMARDLRPPLRKLKQGLAVMVEAREITDEWLQLIENVNLGCDEL